MTAEKFHDALTLLPADLIAEADEMRRRKPRVIRWKRYAAMAACFALMLYCSALLSGQLLPRMGKTAEQAACEMAPAEASPMENASAADMAETQSANITNSPTDSATGSSQISGNSPESAAEESPAATNQDICALPTAPAEEEGLPEFGWDTKKDPGDVPQPIVCDQYSTPSTRASAINTYSGPHALVLTSRTELDAYIEDHAAIYDFTELTTALPAYDDSWFQSNDLLITAVHSAHTGEDWTVTAIKNAQDINAKGWDWYILISNHGEFYPDHPATNFHLLTGLEKGLISPESHILTITDTP